MTCYPGLSAGSVGALPCRWQPAWNTSATESPTIETPAVLIDGGDAASGPWDRTTGTDAPIATYLDACPGTVGPPAAYWQPDYVQLLYP